MVANCLSAAWDSRGSSCQDHTAGSGTGRRRLRRGRQQRRLGDLCDLTEPAQRDFIEAQLPVFLNDILSKCAQQGRIDWPGKIAWTPTPAGASSLVSASILPTATNFDPQ